MTLSILWYEYSHRHSQHKIVYLSILIGIQQEIKHSSLLNSFCKVNIPMVIIPNKTLIDFMVREEDGKGRSRGIGGRRRRGGSLGCTVGVTFDVTGT